MYLVSQVSWIAARLLDTRVFPVHLVDKIILICSVPCLFLIAGLAVVPLTFFKDKITLYCSPEMKCQQVFTTEI